MQDTKRVSRQLIEFIKNPIEGIKHVPDWSHREILRAFLVIVLSVGFLVGVTNFELWRFMSGILFLPFISLLVLIITSFFFYYSVLIFLNQTLSLKKLFILVMLANFPFFLSQPLSYFAQPILLVGFTATALLLIRGLVDNFMLPRQMVIYLVSTLYGFFFLFWLVGRLASH